MARTSHGDTLLELLEQPGARFMSQKTGFDTGTRTFLVDTTYVSAKAPKLDSADSVHRKMYVSNIDFQQEELGRTMLTVSYMGVLSDKDLAKKQEGEISISTGTQDETFRILGTSSTARFVLPIPTVTHVYLTDSRPLMSGVGIIKKPPQISANEMNVNKLWFIPYVTAGTITFADWLITDRQMRQAGGVLWEVTDSYTWRLVRIDD